MIVKILSLLSIAYVFVYTGKNNSEYIGHTFLKLPDSKYYF